VCDAAKVSSRGIEGPPDLVVEILSPATGQKDLTTKRWLYEAAGVPEYLIVYPEERRAERLTLAHLPDHRPHRMGWLADLAGWARERDPGVTTGMERLWLR